MDKLPAILAAFAAFVPALVAFAGLELRHRGRAQELIADRKAAEDRADGFEARLARVEADAFRRVLLLRRVLLKMIDRHVIDDPDLATIRRDIEKEAS